MTNTLGPRTPWRIARREIPQTTLWAATGGTNLTVILGLVFLGSSWGIVLAVAGVTIAISGIAIQEGRALVSRARTILFLSSSDSWFSEQIFQGLESGLHGEMPHEIVKLHPHSSLGRRTVEAQIESLRHAYRRGIDAIVVRPASITDGLIDEMLKYAGAGAMIVFINTRPPLASWRDAQQPLPFFVGSDMEMGGTLVGQLMSESRRRSARTRCS
jgi:hypothetical protein